MKEIKLASLFPNINTSDYKIHFAKRSYGTEPLDVFTRDFDEWKRWNTYTTIGRNDFNKKYIFSLISFYPEPDTWLFGGVWEVISTDFRNKSKPYKIKAVSFYEPFIGRLKIKYQYKKRTTRVKMDKHFDNLIVKEILEEPYSASAFTGYKNIDLPFSTLVRIINSKNKEWKQALSVKGIYLITDTKNGKVYVGKADGALGIWQRWSAYSRNGHGGDEGIKELIEREGYEYALKFFKFSMLELVAGLDEKDINKRESHWKDVLMSREAKYGYNRN